MPSSDRLRHVDISAFPEIGIRGLVMSLNPTSAQRGGQAKIHSCTIRHDSLFKAIWDWLILILVFYTAIEIPYSVTFTLPRRIKDGRRAALSIWFIDEITPLTICNLWVDIMFIVDIFINFRSTFVDPQNDEIVSQPKKIALRYLTTWFIVDFFAAIPFELIMTEKIAGTPASLVGLLKTARLLRLVRVARKLDRYSEYGLAVVILLTCSFMLSAHWLACIWHFIGDSELTSHNGWIMKLADEYGRNSSTPNSGLSVGDRYITALYFCLTSITTVGFGNIAPNTNKEKIFSVCVMIAGALMYAAVFGNMTAIIQRLYSRTSRFHRDLRLVEEFSKFHKIPTALRDDLEEYFRHEWTYTKGVDLENVLNRFPDCLRADICHHLHKKLFDECSAFASAEEGCLRALSIRFTMRHFLPGHYLIKQGDEVTSLFFIVKGSIQVVKDGVTISTLGRGDTISCDYGTLSHTYLPKANASLLIQSHTEVHHIPWNDLLVVLKAYPKFRDNFLNEIELAYNLGDPNEADEISLTDNPSGPRVKRLSNARSTLQTCSPKNSSEKTQLNNGSVQGVSSVRCYSSEIVLNHDTHMPTVILDKPVRSRTQVQNDQIKRMENKLNNIEDRLLNMEKSFNDTLGQLMEVLKNRQESSIETERETFSGTRTTSV